MDEDAPEEGTENDNPWAMTDEEHRAMVIGWQVATREDIHARMRAGTSTYYDVEWLFAHAA